MAGSVPIIIFQKSRNPSLFHIYLCKCDFESPVKLSFVFFSSQSYGFLISPEKELGYLNRDIFTCWKSFWQDFLIDRNVQTEIDRYLQTILFYIKTCCLIDIYSLVLHINMLLDRCLQTELFYMKTCCLIDIYRQSCFT